MKKYFAIAAMMLAAGSAGAADFNVADYYAGFKVQKNANMEARVGTDFGDDYRIKGDPWGYSASFGASILPFARVEIEAGHGGDLISAGYTTLYAIGADYLIYNGYLEYKNPNLKGFAPYAGAGLGWAMRDMLAVVYAAGGKEMRASSSGLSYQLMIGANISLSPKLNLNAGWKYQNYGRIEMADFTTQRKVDIDSSAFYLGAAYKFDW